MKCPGQDPRFWKFDAIFETPCPNCGSLVEFFKDETRRRCKKCGQQVLNPKMDFGCAAHCKFAEHCFGDLPPELIKEKENLFKDRVAVEVKLHFKRDFKRIAHAARVARYAERLVAEEKADPAVVLSAAYLHDVGQGAGDNGQPDRTSAARQILAKLDAAPPLVEAVCDILDRHHRSVTGETANFKVFHDADLLAALEEEQKNPTVQSGDLADTIEGKLLTESGKAAARSVTKDRSEE